MCRYGTAIAALLLITTAAQAQSTTQRDAVGVVVPARSVTLAAKMIGRVVAVSAEEGDKVEAGAVMVELDAAELRAQMASAEANAALTNVEIEHQTRTEARMRKLSGSRNVSEDRLDEAVYALAAARARARIAQAEIERVAAVLEETRLRAPFSGIVTSKTVEVGQLTQPGEPLYRLEDHSRLKLRTSVKEQDVRFIKRDQIVRVTIDALGDVQLDAVVSKIIPSGDTATHAFILEAELPPHQDVLPGMFGRAEFGGP